MKTRAFLLVLIVFLAGRAVWLFGQTNSSAQIIDPYSDPLPPEASARIGTLRFRSADGFRSLAYSPDGRYLVSGGWGGARLWDAATGRLVRRFGEDLPNPTEPADLSPDGKLVAVGGWGQDMGGAVYDVASGRRLYRFGTPSMSVRGCFSPDGKMFAYYPRNDRGIGLLDAATGKELRVLPGHTIRLGGLSLISEAMFMPDNKTLISAGGDGAIRFWDVHSGKETRHITADEVATIALSPNGLHLASVASKKVQAANGQTSYYRDTEVKLWDAQSGKATGRIAARPLKKVHGIEYGPSFLAFSPDSRELLTGAPDGALCIWEIGTGKELRHFAAHAFLSGVAFAPKGTIKVIENHSFRLRDYTTGRDLMPTRGHLGPITTAALSPDGRTVATCDRYEHGLVLWDATTGLEKRRLKNESEAFHTVVFSRDGRRLFATAYDESLWIVELAAKSEPRRVERAASGSLLAVSRDGKTLALDGRDNIRLLDATNGKELRTLEGAKQNMAGLDFTPDGRSLLAWTGDGKLHRWDTTTGRHTAKDFYRLETSPFSVVFSPDGRFVTFGVQNGDFLPVVELATGREVCRFDLVPREPSQTLAWVAFSPDSRTLAWGGRKEGSAWLGELATGGVRHQLTGHRGRIQSLSWSANGKTLVTGSADTTALVWDLAGRLPSDRVRTGALTEAELASSWDELRARDAKRAYAAIRRLAADPHSSVTFLKERLSPVVAADERRLAALIVNLEAGNFAARDKASRELLKLGESALGALQKKLHEKPALETSRRLERLTEQIKALTPDRLQAIRAIEALERMGTSDAQQVLQRLTKGAAEARLTRAARESCDRLESRKAN